MASHSSSSSNLLSQYTMQDIKKMTEYRPSKWYNNFLSQSKNKPLYNEKLVHQEYEPDPNWEMPKVSA